MFTYLNIYIFLNTGARWCTQTGSITEAIPKVFYESLPPILLEPTLEEAKPEKGKYLYPCPVYRTQIREGEILPTGHSTNFIFQLDLPSDKPSDHWIKRGAATVLELCDT